MSMCFHPMVVTGYSYKSAINLLWNNHIINQYIVTGPMFRFAESKIAPNFSTIMVLDWWASSHRLNFIDMYIVEDWLIVKYVLGDWMKCHYLISGKVQMIHPMVSLYIYPILFTSIRYNFHGESTKTFSTKLFFRTPTPESEMVAPLAQCFTEQSQ